MDVETFISKWTAGEGGAERANYQTFLADLCDVIGVARPDPASHDVAHNDYVFERAVKPRTSASTVMPKRIDLYKKGAFILEAKQSRAATPAQPDLLAGAAPPPERRGWDAMMQAARRQAEGYVFLLDTDHPAPPFIIACDVGHCLELFADFTGTGRAYEQFPDRNGFRIFMDDLRRPQVRQQLATIWTDPASLDPTRRSAQVTREIATRLAEVSKALENKGANAEDVAHFLMRCLFTMFAEDTGLLPTDSFKTLLEKCVADPVHFTVRLKALWADMERGAEFSHVIEARVRHFNGGLFANTTAFELGQEEIGELLAAARADWKQVDPAIFGTLLEQALDPDERKRLGAHYTPRAYVQRLVEATVMEPLRADWQAALRRAEAASEAGESETARAAVRAFHHQLCATRVLDPACGTGNFLYVALELMKKLEGEALQALRDLGETQQNLTLAGETVDPHQFLGLELNPRAAAIAELVVWIGYLQWHYRNFEGHPSEPILRAFRNINFGHREGYDAVLAWDGCPLTRVVGGRETWPNPRRPAWPEAEFIVGNPPFIGGKDLRSRLAPGYAEALWAAHPEINESADLVMYWWDRAADLLTRAGTPLRRFGLVSTNSISQVFQRRLVERHLTAKAPISLALAIPDHPWTRATRGAAAVRIAMTVGVAGASPGVLMEVESEAGLDTDAPGIVFRAPVIGRINSDLTVGADVTRAAALLANEGLCSPGVKLHGAGFIVTPAEAEHLGLGKRPGLERHIRPYRNGRDLTAHPRGAMVIDLYGLEADEVRRDFPEVYQHLLETVRVSREKQVAKSPTKDAIAYRDAWWLFGKPRSELRPALAGLDRYIVTVETMRHRLFLFQPAAIIPDNKLICLADGDPATLALLSSAIHCAWAITAGGWLGAGNDSVYVKSRCFDPFPFPDPDEGLRARLRAAGEELDATRKQVQAEHPDLTLTGLYNVLEKVRAGAELSEIETDVRERGRVLILRELHQAIDALTAAAYGWPAGLSDAEILARLVALNAERAAEEGAGHVRWLRPDYQIPRFARAAPSGDLALPETVVAIDKGLPAFPAERLEQPLAVEAALADAGKAVDAAELARVFRRGGRRIEARVAAALATLALYGRIIDLGDGRYASRQAA